jgi:hypothetical protein
MYAVTDDQYNGALEYVMGVPLPTWKGYTEWCDRVGIFLPRELIFISDKEALTQRLLDMYNGFSVSYWNGEG